MVMPTFPDLAAMRPERDVWDSFIANQQQFQNITPLARRFVQQQFSPLQAQYRANVVGGLPGTPGNFRDFLMPKGPTGQTRGALNQSQFRDLFGQVAQNVPMWQGGPGSPAGVQETPTQWQGRLDAMSPEQASGRTAFMEQEGMPFLAQSAMSGVHPLLRSFMGNELARRFSAFEDENLTQQPFEHFGPQFFK
jgi:hypothetical protein